MRLRNHRCWPSEHAHRAAQGGSVPTAPDAFFLCRLLPPRPTFALDMNADERAVMQAHVEYWRTLLAKGTAIVFGPVLDPKGAWGVGVVRAGNEADVREIERGDPAIQSGLGFSYEILPMLRAVFRE